jgi:hypothetical protein
MFKKLLLAVLFLVVLVAIAPAGKIRGESRVIEGKLRITSSESREFLPNPSGNGNVMVSYLEGDSGGTTSIRFERLKKIDNNKYPPDSKAKFGRRSLYGSVYRQRDRDLGQTFLTSDKSFRVDAVYLRVGPNEVKKNTPLAGVGIEIFQVTGKPRLNDNGTPGYLGEFDRKNAPELDDFLEGELYTPIYFATGKLPKDLKKNEYMKWDLLGKPVKLEANSYYAFMVMFLERKEERSLSLSNNYYGSYRPDSENPYVGHGIRREGKPDFPTDWEKRMSMQPGTIGYPDVCTFRDLFFLITPESEIKYFGVAGALRVRVPRKLKYEL